MCIVTQYKTPARIASALKKHLRTHGCAEHAAGVQWFFKEEIQSHGWYTDDLRRYARVAHKSLAGDPAALLAVAEVLFEGRVLEEKLLAVLLAQRSLPRFGTSEFGRFERWLGRVSSWADHDALAMVLLGPLLIANPQRVRRLFTWARSRNRWRRRAAAVVLIHGVRKGLFRDEAAAITDRLLGDNDDMVQKGLGWLLREWCKYRPADAIPVVMRIRRDAPRLVLRTACETLTPAQRRRILAR
jgi:3-methyladenine DNA glycosylase AlkD